MWLICLVIKVVPYPLPFTPWLLRPIYLEPCTTFTPWHHHMTFTYFLIIAYTTSSAWTLLQSFICSLYLRLILWDKKGGLRWVRWSIAWDPLLFYGWEKHLEVVTEHQECYIYTWFQRDGMPTFWYCTLIFSVDNARV